MKREELIALNLTEEQVEAVMRLHGRGITQLQNQLEEQTGELNLSRQEMQEYGSPRELAQTLQSLQEEMLRMRQEHEERMRSREMDYAIRAALTDAWDAGIVEGLLDRSQMRVEDDGTIPGLAEQLAAIRETKPFLFREGSMAGIRPADGQGEESVLSREQIAEMTTRQINENWAAVVRALRN